MKRHRHSVYMKIKLNFLFGLSLIALALIFLTGYYMNRLLHSAIGSYAPIAEPSIALSPSPTPLSEFNVPILMYHYVREVDPAVDPLGYRLSVTSETLDQQITVLKSMGYKPISMKDAIQGKGSPRHVILTFDDGYADFYTAAYPVLKQHGWTATVYVISGRIGAQGYLTRKQILDLRDNGYEIGAHTVNHFDLTKRPAGEVLYEIQQSKLGIEKIIGDTVTSFAYPAGKYNEETIDLVKQSGLLTAVTTHEAIATRYDNPYELPRLRVDPEMTLVKLRDWLR